MNILLIEDNPALRSVMQNFLKGLGHTVYAHASAKTAIESLDSANLDLIFTDILMPMMDGYEFLLSKRNHKIHAETPVVVVSKLSSQHHQYTASQFGAADYIEKPFTKTDIELVLEKYAA